MRDGENWWQGSGLAARRHKDARLHCGHTWQGRPVRGSSLGLDSGAQAAAGTPAVPVFT